MWQKKSPRLQPEATRGRRNLFPSGAWPLAAQFAKVVLAAGRKAVYRRHAGGKPRRGGGRPSPFPSATGMATHQV
jgi:hypothetical protein